MRLTKAQQQSLRSLYRGNPDGSPSYWHFRHRVFPLIGEPMVVGIEPDGYTHS